MTLTKAQKRKLAKAARELASEYAEGSGPKLYPGSWCGCAAGQIFKRASIPNDPTRRSDWRTPAERLDYDFDDILTEATNVETSSWPKERISGAVVFPLLALADELEA